MKKFVSVAGLFACLLVCLNDLYAQTDENFFKTKPVKKELLATDLRRKLDKIERDGGNLSVEYVEVGSVRRMQKDGKLKFKLPSGQGNFTFKARRIEYVSEQEYSWYGRSENEFDEAVILCRKGKVFGSFAGPEGKFEFYTMEDGTQVLLKKDPASKGVCGSDQLAKAVTQTKPSGQARVGNCSDQLRVLVLYNTHANGGVPANQLAEQGVYFYNTAAIESGLDNANRLELAAVEYFEFNELIRHVDVFDYFNDLKGEPTVQSRRDFHNADIVVQLVGGGYLPTGGHSFLYAPGGDYNLTQGYIGFANEIAPSSADNGFAIFVAGYVGSTALLPHEIGHLLGGEHQYGAPRANLKPYSAAYGFQDNTGNYRRTIMWSILYSDNILRFSNPDISYNGVPTGTVLTENNARRIREFAPTVNNFRPSSDGSVYVEVRRPVPNSAYYEFEAVHSCRPAIGFEWEISPDGFNYGGVVSYAETFATNIYNSPSGYSVVRCKVTFNNGTIRFVYTNVPNQYCPGCREGVSSELADKANALLVSPNPSTDQATLRFTLETSTEVSRLLINAQGNIVQRANYGRLEAGVHEKAISVDKLPTGVYFVNLRTGTTSTRQKLIVTH